MQNAPMMRTSDAPRPWLEVEEDGDSRAASTAPPREEPDWETLFDGATD
jgi:hypothetical protein